MSTENLAYTECEERHKYQPAEIAVFALNSRIKLSMLPPRLTLRIFSTQIAPILLHGTEVWAAYSNFNFSNWDKTCIERTHTQFLKRILGCDIHSPNLMVRGELGKRPLLCDAIRRSVLYIKQVALYTGTLAYHALDQELSLNDESNIFI